MSTNTRARLAHNGAGLSSFIAEPELNAASKTNRGLSDNSEYSSEVIHSSSDQDSDSRDNKGTAEPSGDR